MLPPVPMPQLRSRVKADVAKNRGLKDIISSTAKALEVISVQKVEYGIHNTQAVVLIEENGIQEERVLIYNRVDIRAAISQFSGPILGLQFVLDELNQQGYDVTEDDIEIANGVVVVKDTSLGYYEGEVDAGNCALRHYFKVTLLGADKDQSWDDVCDALRNSFVNLTAPAQPQLQFVADRHHVLNDGVYQYTIVNVGILDYASNGGGENMSVQFTLPLLEGISVGWSEILPTGPILMGGPIVSVAPQFSTLTTFGPDDSHTIVRCIVTEYSVA